MRYYYLIICMLLAFSCEQPKESYTDYSRWETYSGDPTGAKYSSLAQINLDNVKNLTPAWVIGQMICRLLPEPRFSAIPSLLET